MAWQTGGATVKRSGEKEQKLKDNRVSIVMGNDTNKDGSPPSRFAIYLSALVWPGVGQYAQKRWLAGTFYAVVFLVCIVFLFTAIFAPMFWNLRMLAEYSGKEEIIAFHPVSFVKIMVWFGLSVLVYLGNLLDTVICYKRQRRQD